MTRETFDPDELDRVEITDRQLADADRPFLPFEAPADRLVPDFLPIGGKRAVRQTSSTHGPDGYITTDAQQIRRNQYRLEHKITSAVGQFTYHDLYPVSGADTLVIAYGVTVRAARAAVKQAEQNGVKAALLVLKTLWPVPEELIQKTAAGYRRIVVVEMNLGQYVREIQRLLPHQPIQFLGQMNGELIKPAQIQEVIANG